MKTYHIVAMAVSSLLSLTASAETSQPVKGTSRIDPLPRDLEIQLALSALPPHLRNDATIYVLNPDKGFEVARKGTNGFHTFVARTGDDTMRGSWPFTKYRDDILYPVSFDSAGAKAIMPVFFDIAEMQAKGTSPGELKRLIQERYKTGHYKAPERAGISYMLSPILRTYVAPDKDASVDTDNFPHIMHFAPNTSNENVGGLANPYVEGSPRFYPFVHLRGPHGYTIQGIGQAETAAITKEHKQMLTRLCTIKQLWCLPAKKG